MRESVGGIETRGLVGEFNAQRGIGDADLRTPAALDHKD
jgi:hypothetical protein